MSSRSQRRKRALAYAAYRQGYLDACHLINTVLRLTLEQHKALAAEAHGLAVNYVSAIVIPAEKNTKRKEHYNDHIINA